MGQDVTTLAVAFNSSSYDTALLWTGATGRYQAIHESELDSNDHMWRVADSVSVDLNNGAASFILFADFEDVPAGSPDDYASFKGAFCQLTNAAPGTSFEVDLGPLDWKDRAASMMLVNTQRGPETRKSVRDTFLETWNSVLSSNLPDNVEQDGDPYFSWDAFPIWDLKGSLSPTKIYVTISQNLIVHPPYWPSDYSTNLTYWIQLHRKSDGMLLGSVARTWVWVEAGALHDQVLAGLIDAAQQAVKTINQKIKAELDSIPPVKDLYLLPGRQLKPVKNGTWDIFIWRHVNDVTIVVEP